MPRLGDGHVDPLEVSLKLLEHPRSRRPAAGPTDSLAHQIGVFRDKIDGLVVAKRNASLQEHEITAMIG
jgi:hypothetical protein